MSLVERPAPPPDSRRILVMSMAAIALALVLIVRLWYLQIVLGDELLLLSEQNRTRVIRRAPPRGLITDTAGRVLATTRSRIVVRVLPEEHRKHPDVLAKLAKLLGVRARDLQATFEANQVDGFQPVRVASDIGLSAATRIEEHGFELPGVLIGPEPVRTYPAGPAFGHVLGYVGQCSERDLETRKQAGYMRGDNCGKTGVEGGELDGLLRGKDGGTTYEVDARGRIRSALENTYPVPGATIKLTLDAGLQELAYSELNRYARLGKPGAAVAMDPRDGTVLALVSVPSYDPEAFATGIKKDEWARVRDHPLRPLINRAAGSATAPGSVFKLVTTIAGLETGKTSPYDSAYCSGVIYLGKWPKRCHRRSGHGAVGLREAIAKSCDVFFYRLGQRLGPDTMATYARAMGFGAKSGVDLPGVESAGVVPDPRWKARKGLGPWVGGDTVDYAIGQAMLGCTPLQVCNMVSAIANGGTLYVPRLADTVTVFDEHGTSRVRPVAGKVVRRLKVRPETLRTVIGGMVRVMQAGGTAARSAIPGVTVAGKTGTAERHRRGEMVNDAWFVAFAPVENPKIAVCVYVEEGGHGGETAAPIARTIISKHLGINPPPPPTGVAQDAD